MKTYPRDTPEYLGTNTRGVNPKTWFFLFFFYLYYVQGK